MCSNPNLRGFTQALTTLFQSPTHFLPHLTIPTFTHLPEHLGSSLPYHALTAPTVTSTTPTNHEGKESEEKKPGRPTIRALVLDKDNTLCPPQTTTFPPQILTKLHNLRTSPISPFRNPSSILIVSNRAGSHPRFDEEVHDLENTLSSSSLHIPIFGVPAGVEKKPLCGDAVVEWFRERGVVQGADEIAVVGDRLGTDVLMAGMMGSWGVWCRDGVVEGVKEGMQRPGMNVLERMEVLMERYLRESRGLRAAPPRGWTHS